MCVRERVLGKAADNGVSVRVDRMGLAGLVLKCGGSDTWVDVCVCLHAGGQL